jgi:predicted lipid-binding transport protein (Tim44 family)
MVEVSMEKKRWVGLAVLGVTFFFMLGYVLEADSFARVGGGGFSGSRGSRSFSSPSRPSPGPSQSYGRPTSPTPPAQQPIQQPGGGFFRSMAGGIAGGFLGSMLFRSLGFGGFGDGMGGGGIGFFEIALLALVLFLLYRFIKRRREAAMSGANYQGTEAPAPTYQQSYEPNPSYNTAPSGTDVEQGLRYVRQMDPYFDEQKFRDLCTDYFFKIQGAWTGRDATSARNLLTPEMYRTIQADADKLRSEKKVNRLENIALRSVEITEAWQEQGQDYITVLFLANLLDYVVDETSGQVVSGSKVDPVKFEEYWTFTRNVGNNPWQLSAINQAN